MTNSGLYVDAVRLVGRMGEWAEGKGRRRAVITLNVDYSMRSFSLSVVRRAYRQPKGT